MPSRVTFAPLLFLLAIALGAPCRAQLIQEAPTDGVAEYGDAVVGQFRVGAEITASRGACRNIVAMVAVPLECAEQDVKIADEEFSNEVQSVTYRDLPGGGARQMVIRVPYLASGATARAVVTFEVATRPILPPDDDQLARLKAPERPPREVRQFLSPSPYIESRHGSFRRLARDLTTGADPDTPDWARVENLYDHMLSAIEYEKGPDKSALDTLRDGAADCHGRSAVFIALCRAAGVPARVVWVNNHCYPEFYMEDEEGQGHWFPAESAGSRAFGEMPLARVILQKGDDFRVPERPRDRLRYATDFLVGQPLPGGAKPRARFIREQL